MKSLNIEKGYLSEQERKDIFPHKDVKAIRDELETMGVDRHLPIEFTSTEVCVKTPKGILMQVRATDKGALGMWGGVVEDGEKTIDGAIRELQEETGILTTSEKMQFMEVNRHEHTYANGDKALFTTYRYLLVLAEIPQGFALDEESVDVTYVRKKEDCEKILSHQKEFIERMIDN